MVEVIQDLQAVDWGTFLGAAALLIVSVPKIKKYLDEFESNSGFVFPWTTKKRELDSRFKELDDKIDSKYNELQEKIETIHSKEHEEHEVWHQQSITIRDNLATNQEQLAKNQEKFVESLNGISTALSEIKEDLLEERLERKRWNILNCASKLRNSDVVDIEEFNNVFQDYDSYEDLISKNGKKNGLIEESIKFIREKYQENLYNE